MMMAVYILSQGFLLFWGLKFFTQWWFVDFHQHYHDGYWIQAIIIIFGLSIWLALSSLAEWWISVFFQLRPLSEREQLALAPLL